ncbi:MAG: NAD(P)-dependent alcohol dehydrogenase [Trueperaceae bacterium]|nr:NAD(P)-dependent alcohol dehydrogenase [Trueperaceae bacterium]
MKAVVYDKYGPPEVLQLTELAKPSPKDNEILIRVHATSVTTGDVNARDFVFAPPGLKPVGRLMLGYNKPKKRVLGTEFSGQVEAVGNSVLEFKAGDEVYGMPGTVFGSYADYICLPEDGVVTQKPVNMTYEQAAAVPFGAHTALYFLRDKARVQAGQSVLILGASGGVGSYAVQLAKAFGATVTGVCSTRNLERVKEIGADRVIDYTKVDFTQEGKRYDFIMDVVGKSSFEKVKSSLESKGKYLAVAGGLKEFGQMLTTSLFSSKKVLAGQAVERKEDLVFLRELIEAGKLTALIDRCYSLEQIVEAHRYVDTGHKQGNVVIRVAEKEAGNLDG